MGAEFGRKGEEFEMDLYVKFGAKLFGYKSNIVKISLTLNGIEIKLLGAEIPLLKKLFQGSSSLLSAAKCADKHNRNKKTCNMEKMQTLKADADKDMQNK